MNRPQAQTASEEIASRSRRWAGSVAQGAPEGTAGTLLIPLYARVLDSRWSRPSLGDKKADEIVPMIDYDLKAQRLRRQERLGHQGEAARRVDQGVPPAEHWRRRAEPRLRARLKDGRGETSPERGLVRPRLPRGDGGAKRKKFLSDREGYQTLEASLTDPGRLEGAPRGGRRRSSRTGCSSASPRRRSERASTG